MKAKIFASLVDCIDKWISENEDEPDFFRDEDVIEYIAYGAADVIDACELSGKLALRDGSKSYSDKS